MSNVAKDESASEASRLRAWHEKWEPLPCIGLARLKFELNNQTEVSRREKRSVLTSTIVKNSILAGNSMKY